MVTRSKTAAKPKSETPSAAAPAKATTAKKAATAKPPAAKPAARQTAAAGKKPAATAKKTPARSAVAHVTPEQRRYYVEVAAYYIAERRGFHGGNELDDWVQAEQEIDRLLRDGLIGG